jgi:hypothetical protein
MLAGHSNDVVGIGNGLLVCKNRSKRIHEMCRMNNM